jgi:hypothetical protein
MPTDKVRGKPRKRRWAPKKAWRPHEVEMILSIVREHFDETGEHKTAAYGLPFWRLHVRRFPGRSAYTIRQKFRGMNLDKQLKEEMFSSEEDSDEEEVSLTPICHKFTAEEDAFIRDFAAARPHEKNWYDECVVEASKRNLLLTCTRKGLKRHYLEVILKIS